MCPFRDLFLTRTHLLLRSHTLLLRTWAMASTKSSRSHLDHLQRENTGLCTISTGFHIHRKPRNPSVDSAKRMRVLRAIRVGDEVIGLSVGAARERFRFDWEQWRATPVRIRLSLPSFQAGRSCGADCRAAVVPQRVRFSMAMRRSFVEKIRNH